ncbi:DUF29 domain-containing protein [Synechococcus sp. PCC 6312]|uniref:DUF29 domain-containing protein n=1 Tax=Synechococcus sp. (strain ATCC 27167 / PCC 6312) TaxID=195253 RepID=UPI00029EFB86|nr:DUF29 domain-containing protein [Synechococcus sp. PCC 6312]AFY60937.1 protein of unknown function DUF29 [Synechococcus sp. PCC 6312]
MSSKLKILIFYPGLESGQQQQVNPQLRPMNPSSLHEQDFLQWTEHQITCLNQGCWQELDVLNLIEELEALGRREQRELGSYLQVLLLHLLKCRYQPERKTTSWEITISNCRDRIQDCLEDTPSLRRFLEDSAWLNKYYQRARRDAAKETQMPIQRFPSDCPFSRLEILASQS